ncbi:MAG: hypothetical protein APG11_01865 [Candidatus Methanofastidiosum methylothiophilum]|uniref:CDP-Glycerol:Poly(Glycerophosphate) glycerophosphotransferase n=1 Tax=Candidatus Methanofastidiosum methylothiophilum TaxID=1705564 RepID=A0A150INQ5_9EURY|nr:MAG: hypothetical protein APG11_01865 [Candidatus Methanofastidiosum methylthiophilus]
MIPKKDLRWYLFEETIEMYAKNGLNNYEKHRYKDLNRFLSDYYIFRLVGMTSKICNKLSKFNKKGDNQILVHDLLNRYPSIINQLEINYNPIFFGKGIKPFIKSLKGKIGFYPFYDIYKEVYEGILDYNDNLLEKGFMDLEKVLKKIDPKLIVLNHDFTTDTKLVALVAKELEIPTVEIQHGIYSGKGTIVPGNYADYVFVWGEYFKNLYLASKIKQDREIRILGYPYQLQQQKLSHYNKKVVYLGQNLELYDDSFLNQKDNTINELNSLCSGLGLQFIYRPHPSQNLGLLKSNFPEVRFTPEGETFADTIKNNDIFISFNSTALIEAAVNSKLSIQLKNYSLPADDFEELGICRSFTSLSELKEFLKDIKTLDDLKSLYSPVDPSYIEIPTPNSGEKFIELIKEIL